MPLVVDHIDHFFSSSSARDLILPAQEDKPITYPSSLRKVKGLENDPMTTSFHRAADVAVVAAGNVLSAFVSVSWH